MTEAEDNNLIKWLSEIGEVEQVDVRICGNELILRCRNAYLAYERWKKRGVLKSTTGLELTVYLGDRLIDSTSQCRKSKRKTMITTYQSSWIKSNKNLFESFKNSYTVSIQSESKTTGYQYLDVQPFLGIEEVLNKPINQLLGQPASIVESVIAEARIHCIERAIASGGISMERYKHNWQGLLWSFQLTAIYLPGHQEVLVRTENGEPWQTGYWQNWLAQKNIS